MKKQNEIMKVEYKEVKSMLDNEKRLTREVKIDLEDIARELKRLPEKEREKVYYMIRGANLLTDNDPFKNKLAIWWKVKRGTKISTGRGRRYGP